MQKLFSAFHWPELYNPDKIIRKVLASPRALEIINFLWFLCVLGYKPFYLCLIHQKKVLVCCERVFLSIPCLSCVVLPSTAWGQAASWAGDPTNADLRTHTGEGTREWDFINDSTARNIC